MHYQPNESINAIEIVEDHFKLIAHHPLQIYLKWEDQSQYSKCRGLKHVKKYR